jgi:signal transduction histidine kinase
LAPETLIAELQLELDQAVLHRPIVPDWELDAHTPPLLTDSAKVPSIVRNLVRNAVKFTARGNVRIHVSYDHASATHRIEVADTGPGIPPDVLPYIFQRFYRGSQSGAGSGFGLFIVKRFTELLGGTIGVESELGHGTRFVVTVPPLSAEAQQVLPPGAVPLGAVPQAEVDV